MDWALTLTESTEEVIIYFIDRRACESLNVVAFFELRLHVEAEVYFLSILHHIASPLLNEIGVIALCCSRRHLIMNGPWTKILAHRHFLDVVVVACQVVAVELCID